MGLFGGFRNIAAGALDTYLGMFGLDSGSISLSCRGSSIKLPVTPEEFFCSVSNKNGTVNINNDGDYNMIGMTGLKSISLSSFFPAQYYSFCVCTPKEPSEYVETIEAWRTSGYPVTIVITGTSINLDCLIESFTYGYKDGTEDIYYTLSLKEYRYIQGVAADKIDGITGLKTRPKLSYLQRAGITAARNILRGHSPASAVASAVSSAGLTDKQKGYLAVYEGLTKKHGKVATGDILKIVAGSVKLEKKKDGGANG